MLNLKLKAIASFVNKNDTVIDIGSDHAYLAIYLKENNLAKEVYASDISKKALQNARKNIQKRNITLNTYLSDGFNNISNKDIDTAIIAGMGTKTIMDIISTSKIDINKYIISSNNNFEELRYFMSLKNYYIKEEVVILENKIYYPIMVFVKGQEKLEKYILKYGKSNNLEYYQYLLDKETTTLIKIPRKYFLKRLKLKLQIRYLKTKIKELQK